LAEADPIAGIGDERIVEISNEICSRAHPAANIASFKGVSEVRALAHSIAKNGQLDPGKKTASGKTYIGRTREVACTLLGDDFRFEQTDLLDDDPRVVVQATDSNTEGRHDSVGQASCSAARERLYYEQNFPGWVPTFEELARKYKKSGRSIRDAVDVYQACPDLFECIERNWTSVHQAKDIVDKVEPASWLEALEILRQEFEPEPELDPDADADPDEDEYVGNEEVGDRRAAGDYVLRSYRDRKASQRRRAEAAAKRKAERKERSEKLKTLPRIRKKRTSSRGLSEIDSQMVVLNPDNVGGQQEPDEAEAVLPAGDQTDAHEEPTAFGRTSPHAELITQLYALSAVIKDQPATAELVKALEQALEQARESTLAI
jgi:hypothetical protein